MGMKIENTGQHILVGGYIADILFLGIEMALGVIVQDEPTDAKPIPAAWEVETGRYLPNLWDALDRGRPDYNISRRAVPVVSDAYPY